MRGVVCRRLIATTFISNLFLSLPLRTKSHRVFTGNMDTAIEKTKALAEQYRIQKRGLMQKLLTGKWRIQSGDN